MLSKMIEAMLFAVVFICVTFKLTDIFISSAKKKANKEGDKN